MTVRSLNRTALSLVIQHAKESGSELVVRTQNPDETRMVEAAVVHSGGAWMSDREHEPHICNTPEGVTLYINAEDGRLVLSYTTHADTPIRDEITSLETTFTVRAAVRRQNCNDDGSL